jgi:hypothetical protein
MTDIARAVSRYEEVDAGTTTRARVTPRIIPRAIGTVIAALVATAPSAPIVAGVVTVATYAASPIALPLGEYSVLAMSLINLLGTWGTMAVLYALLGFTSVERANPGSYGELVARRDELRAHWVAECHEQHAGGTESAPETCRRCTVDRVVQGHLDAIDDDLRATDARWVLGSGYINLWSRLLRAETHLIEIEPATEVLGKALHDQLRIAESSIDNRARLAAHLNRVIHTLAPRGGLAPEVLISPGSDTRQTELSGDECRVIAQEVRTTINSFRASRWAGLVRVRNLLAATAGLTGVTVYALLWLGIAANIERDTVHVMLLFYLIGASTGLFGRLYSQASADTMIDDYGLSLTRLISATLISGQAALIGVVLFQMLVGPQPSVDEPRILSALESAIRQPHNIVTAAVLGLTPGVLIDRLAKESDRYKADLRGSTSKGSAQSRNESA